MPESQPSPSASRRRLGGLALTAWFVATLGLGAGLLARHAVALPALTAPDRVGATLGALRRPEDRGRFLAVHVLYAACRCSQRIVDHLVTTARPAGWSELVLWVGDEAPSPELSRRGFTVQRLTRAELSRHGVEAAPLLVAIDPEDHVRYQGGYTERKQGPVIADLRILEAARDATAAASLPVFGCAVSDRLQRALTRLPSP
jgi:hypothetical protein